MIENFLTEEVEAKLGDLAKVFNQDLDTDWKYVEWLYQAFKARMKIEAEAEAREDSDKAKNLLREWGYRED